MDQSKKDIIDLLKSIPSLEAFNESELAEIADSHSIFKSFRKGGLIIEQGDMDASVCILLKGTAYIRKRERPDIEIVTLAPGQIFGEMTYILKVSRTTDVVAKSDNVMVLQLDDEMLENLSPSIISKFKDVFLLVLAKRLAEMNDKLSSLKLEVKGLIQAHDQLVTQIDNSSKSVVEHLSALNMSMSDLVQ
jgi:serine/threonine-protein kinase